jgi:hypothetical protein
VLSVRCRSAVGPLSVRCRSAVGPLSVRCRSAVGPLSAAGLHQAARGEALEHAVQEQQLAPVGDEPRAEFTEHAEVEAGVAELQAQRVLPVDARAHRLGGLPVGEPLEELQHGDERPAPRRPRVAAARGGRAWRQRVAPARRKERGEVGVLIERPELVPQTHARRRTAERGARHTRRLLGDRRQRARL